MPRKQTTPVSDAISATSPSIASFETEFERLTAIVDRLEEGNVPLGDMLKLYEEGMVLTSNLKVVLGEAELKVEKLAAMHEESVMAVATDDEDDDDITDSDDESDLLF